MDSPDILSVLRKTSKGSLNYDTAWYDSGSITQIVDECTSPPKLHHDMAAMYSFRNTSHDTSDLAVDCNGEASLGECASDDRVSEAQCNLQLDGVMRHMEANWLNSASVALLKRQQRFDADSKNLQQQGEQQLLQLRECLQQQATAALRATETQETVRTEEMAREHMRVKESHKQHAQLQDSKIRAAHSKQREEDVKVAQRQEQQQQKQQECRHQEDEENLATMLRVEGVLQAVERDAAAALHRCTHPARLTENVRDYPTLMARILAKVGELVREARATQATPRHVSTVLDLCASTANLQKHVVQQVDTVNAQAAEETAKQQQEQQKQQQQQQEKQQQINNEESDATQTSDAAKKDSVEAVDLYEKLLQQLSDVDQISQEFSNNSSLKSYKFELQKAINTTVNAIAPTNGAHIRDKIKRICTLLSGHLVTVGGKRIGATEHPAAITFCKNLFAKKIVQQGNQQVASNHDSAFAIAAVAVAVWCEFPDVGELILAHFYRECPYLVPYHLSKQPQQSNEDYYKSLGYTYDDGGTVEQQDHFLKRMSGLMLLYAAVMFTHPPPPAGSRTSPPHPHGVQHAWTWLTRITNMLPMPSVTATITHDLLQTCAGALEAVYGRQMHKLLELVRTGLMARLREVEPAGASGPVMRLQTFLDKACRERRFQPPSGHLDFRFWQT